MVGGVAGRPPHTSKRGSAGTDQLIKAAIKASNFRITDHQVFCSNNHVSSDHSGLHCCRLLKLLSKVLLFLLDCFDLVQTNMVRQRNTSVMFERCNVPVATSEMLRIAILLADSPFPTDKIDRTAKKCVQSVTPPALQLPQAASLAPPSRVSLSRPPSSSTNSETVEHELLAQIFLVVRPH